MSDSWRLHGLQPTRLLCPWGFPGKSTGVGCHCRLHTFCLTSLNFASLDKNYKHPKYYILYCFIHVAFWKRQNCRKKKYIRGLQGIGESDYIYVRWAWNEICRVWGLSIILLYGCMMVVQSKPIELYTTNSEFFFFFWLYWVFLGVQAFLQLQRAGGTLVVMCGLLIMVASLITEHRV